MGDLDDYLEKQRAGGVESEGHFTLDPAMARKKLAACGFPRPEYCLLKFVQAGVAFGCSSVEVECTRKQITFRFPGLPRLGSSEWEHLLSSPLQGRSRAEEHLAIGTLTALDLAEEICWSQDLTSERLGFRLTEHGFAFHTEAVLHKPPQLVLKGRLRSAREFLNRRCLSTPTTAITINGKPVQPNPTEKHEVLLESYLGCAPERALLFALPDHKAMVRLRSDGRLWSEPTSGVWPFQTKPHAYLYELTTPHEEWPRCQRARARLRLFNGEESESSLEVVRDGVLLEPHRVDLPFRTQVVATGETLQTDLSGFQLVRNRALRDFLQDLDFEVDRLAGLLRIHPKRLPPIHPMPSTDTDLPRHFAGYLLLERLRERWNEESYRAVPTALSSLQREQTVTYCHESQGAELFNSETERFAKLDHPHIVKILDAGVFHGVPYRVEPARSKLTLRSRMQRGTLTLDQVWPIAHGLCSAVETLHRSGVPCALRLIPSNIVWGQGKVCLAAGPGRRGPMNQNVRVLPLPEEDHPMWFAPETIAHQVEWSPRQDQYILGLLLYRLFTGRQLFDDPDLLTAINEQILNVPEDPRTLAPHLPAAAARALLRALEKTPEARFKDVKAFSTALFS